MDVESGSTPGTPVSPVDPILISNPDYVFLCDYRFDQDVTECMVGFYYCIDGQHYHYTSKEYRRCVRERDECIERAVVKRFECVVRRGTSP